MALFLLGLVSWQFAARSATLDAKVISKLPQDYYFIPKSQLGSKPMIDLTVFGRQFVFPPRKTVSHLAVASNRMSGLIVYRQSALKTAQIRTIEWVIDGKTYAPPLIDTAFGPDFIEVPVLYGESKKATLKVDHHFDPSWTAEVELPGNGEQPLPSAPFAHMVGSWTLRFTPLSRPADLLEQRYRVEVVGAGDQCFLLEIGNSGAWISENAGVLLKAGREATFGPWGTTKVLHLTLCLVEPVETVLTPETVQTAGGPKVNLKTPDGTLILRGPVTPAGVLHFSWDQVQRPERKELIVDGILLSRTRYFRDLPSHRANDSNQSELIVKTGKPLPTTYYRVIRQEKAIVALPD